MSAIPQELLDTGITYRQLDHWVVKGWLLPDTGRTGQGVPREWPERELRIARAMVRLVDAGMRPDVAAVIARSGQRYARVSDHVVIGVTP